MLTACSTATGTVSFKPTDERQVAAFLAKISNEKKFPYLNSQFDISPDGLRSTGVVQKRLHMIYWELKKLAKLGLRAKIIVDGLITIETDEDDRWHIIIVENAISSKEG